MTINNWKYCKFGKQVHLQNYKRKTYLLIIYLFSIFVLTLDKKPTNQRNSGSSFHRCYCTHVQCFEQSNLTTVTLG